ncbi:SDR family oxidoreductase [Archangium violaceum]|uniref:SDR family oxidoreductase n=1 Tax=Archangium violaceum TaxID=83451 RepID=UPI00194FF724|nr:SDR family oxidoreductase [Archangium violaceum]QRO01505.1 SDR family oxidoreductase [Archangium violaceum]
MSKVWFITGASRGFGRAFVEAALGRGDRVAATVRNADALADLSRQYGEALLVLTLDVTNRDAVFQAVGRATERFGRLDVVVNNAGFGLFGAIEELSEQDIRHQLDVNVLGALWVTQAVLPTLRAQKSGHILQISSIGGVGAFPNLGGYHASKWALEGFSESLAQEVGGLGIKVTLVEPGLFATDWGGASAVRSKPHPAYDGLRTALASQRSGAKAGDPKAAARALLKVVDAEKPPLRVLFGQMPTKLVQHLYTQRLKTWGEWEQVSVEAEGTSPS